MSELKTEIPKGERYDLAQKIKSFRKRLSFSEVGAKPYMNPYLAGVLVGMLLFFSFIVVGKGLGGSGAYTRILAVSMQKVAPVHTEKVEYFRRYLTDTKFALNHWLVYMLIGSFFWRFAFRCSR